jgi:mRNA-degrading endonuclease RelE of RelBE toxin-antitoxin system
VPKGRRADAERRATKLWSVEIGASAARDIRAYGLDDARFRPTLRELVEELKRNPLHFPTKRGNLKNARAANLSFQGSSWRLVFVVSVVEHRVRILAVGPHDVAYDRAARRI